MNSRNRRVLVGYMSLTDAERQEVDGQIDRFKRTPEYQRRDLRESFQKMDLGPVGSGGEVCPCCLR